MGPMLFPQIWGIFGPKANTYTFPSIFSLSFSGIFVLLRKSYILWTSLSTTLTFFMFLCAIALFFVITVV